MTNADYTHLTLVVDRSGSMGSVQEEAQSGINALVAEQFAVPGKLTVTLSQFDNAFDTVSVAQLGLPGPGRMLRFGVTIAR